MPFCAARCAISTKVRCAWAACAISSRRRACRSCAANCARARAHSLMRACASTSSRGGSASTFIVWSRCCPVAAGVAGGAAGAGTGADAGGPDVARANVDGKGDCDGAGSAAGVDTDATISVVAANAKGGSAGAVLLEGAGSVEIVAVCATTTGNARADIGKEGRSPERWRRPECSRWRRSRRFQPRRQSRSESALDFEDGDAARLALVPVDSTGTVVIVSTTVLAPPGGAEGAVATDAGGTRDRTAIAIVSG